MQVLGCPEQKIIDGRHDLMYFDIALPYDAAGEGGTTQQTTQKRIIIPAPHRLPSHTGFGMLIARVFAAGSNQP